MLIEIIIVAILILPLLFLFFLLIRFLRSLRCARCRRFLLFDGIDQSPVTLSDIFFPRARICFTCRHLARSP